MSYNSTGLDSAKIDFIENLQQVFDVHLFQMQEHFKVKKNVLGFEPIIP